MIWTRENLGSATSYQQTQPDWVYASARISYEDRSIGYNINGVKDYLNSFQQYANAMNERPDLAATFKPPVPPFKYVVKDNNDGWPMLVQSDELVVQPMIYTPPSQPVLAEGLIGSR